MKAFPLACVRVAVLLAPLAFTGGSSAAPTLERAPAPADLERVKPAALPAPKKLEVTNKVLKGLGPILNTLPPAQAEVTPLAPAHAGGSRIVHAAPITFMMTGGNAVYFLAPANGGTGEVKIELTLEKNKAYLLDCRLAPVWGGAVPVTFARSGTSSVVQSDGGHYLYAFQAPSTSQTVSLTATSGIGFYGCEITKAN